VLFVRDFAVSGGNSLFRGGRGDVCDIDCGIGRWRASGAREGFDPGHALSVRRNFGLLKIADAEHRVYGGVGLLWWWSFVRGLRARAQTSCRNCKQHCNSLHRLPIHDCSNPIRVCFLPLFGVPRTGCAADMLRHAAQNINPDVGSECFELCCKVQRTG